MNTSSPLLFSALGPETVLDALASIGMHSDGRLMALNSYENRVYQVGMDDASPVITKFYRPARWSNEQIQEEHDFLRELTDAEIPVVAPLATPDGKSVQEYETFRFAVFPRRGGRAPELDRADTLEWLGRFIGRIHAIGAVKPFAVRPAIDIASFGDEPRDYLLENGFLPADLRAAYDSVVLQALQGVRQCFDRAGEVRSIRLHGDCHVGNVLWTDAGPHFVDFDDSRMGPAVQDLWMLLSGDRRDMTRQLADLLAGYEDFMEFNERELHLVEALRTLRLIHYSAWLARRWEDPAFPVAFPWFNSQRYWQDHILALREQVALMDEAPLWGGV
jgi:Ser/Thr protein kinase RdoA (MazF antagonist)